MTEFEQKCYKTLKQKVKSGKVISYGNLAKLVGKPKAARAVGNAMHKNPNAPDTPCHRVVKADGKIGGFNNDINLKITRLKSEGINIDKNHKIINFQAHQLKTPSN